MQDLHVLREYFVARDARGVARGVPEALVRECTRRLERFIGLMHLPTADACRVVCETLAEQLAVIEDAITGKSSRGRVASETLGDGWRPRRRRRSRRRRTRPRSRRSSRRSRRRDSA